MTIEQMKMLLCVARTASVSQAAQQMYISQPALSKAIRSAEQELGRQLFVRTSTGVQQTEFGKQFFTTAQRIVESYEQVRSIASQSREIFCPAIRICTCPLRFAGWAFGQLLRKYDRYATEMHFVSGSVSSCVRSVEEGHSDLALICLPLPMGEMIPEKLEKRGLYCDLLHTFAPAVLIPGRPSVPRDADPAQLLQGLKLVYTFEEQPLFEEMNRRLFEQLGLDVLQDVVYRDARLLLSGRMLPGEFRCVAHEGRFIDGVYTGSEAKPVILPLYRQTAAFCYGVYIVQKAGEQPNPLAEEYIKSLYAITGFPTAPAVENKKLEEKQ